MLLYHILMLIFEMFSLFSLEHRNLFLNASLEEMGFFFLKENVLVSNAI